MVAEVELTIKQVFQSKRKLENWIIFCAFFLNLTWYLIRCTGALLIPEFFVIYEKIFLKDTLMFVFVLVMIPILKLMSRGVQENFLSLSIPEKTAVKLLSPRFEPHILIISLGISAYILYSYINDYLTRLVSFPKYLGVWGFIAQIAYALIFLTGLLFLSQFFVQLFFLNKAMPYIKVDLFHEDGYCGFQKMGKYFLRMAMILFIIISLVILLSIFSTSKKTTEDRILYTVFSIVITFPIAFAAFFYPQTGMKKVIEHQKNSLLHQLLPVLPHDPILIQENFKPEEINFKLYNWAIYQRLEKVKLFQYDPEIIKKLFYAGLSPFISAVLGLLITAII